MHGIIFTKMKMFVDQNFGPETWGTLLKEAGLESKVYIPQMTYPDEEAIAIVSTAAKMTGQPVADILEDFGKYIATSLIDMYKVIIDPKWTTIDLIANTEDMIHSAIREDQKGADPPVLNTKRPSPEQVVIKYSSPRQMCPVLKGIAKGIADHNNEKINIDETTCMLNGDPNCTVSISLAS